MMKKRFMYLLTAMIVATLSMGVMSCSDDDEGVLDLATEVSGEYVGTLKPMGYSDDPARCYVTITRLSNDAVRLTNLICEEFDLDINPINLTIKEQGNGRVSLQSETTKSVEGTYYRGQLTLSFTTAIATFYFSGGKN